jgi:hypothetical protein
MKAKFYLIATLFSLNCFAQKVEYQNIRLGEIVVPAIQPLPKEFHNYEFVINTDSVYDLLQEYYTERLNANIKYGFTFQGYQPVEENGDFKFELVLGTMHILEDGPALAAKVTSLADSGYLYEIKYTMRIDVLVKSKDNKLISTIPIRTDEEVCVYDFGPNYGLIRPEQMKDKKGRIVEVAGSVDWNYDEVFNSSNDAVNKFNQYRNVLFSIFVTDNVIDLFWSKVLQTISIMHIERRPYYNTGIYTVEKKERKNFDYHDMDSAYLCFVKAMNGLKLNTFKRDSINIELKKCLQIYQSAYDTAGVRISPELKNALAFNIANVNYLLGNGEEAKKYEALYVIKNKDEFIKEKNILFNDLTKGRNENLVLSEELWCTRNKYIELLTVGSPKGSMTSK